MSSSSWPVKQTRGQGLGIRVGKALHRMVVLGSAVAYQRRPCRRTLGIAWSPHFNRWRKGDVTYCAVLVRKGGRPHHPWQRPEGTSLAFAVIFAYPSFGGLRARERPQLRETVV